MYYVVYGLLYLFSLLPLPVLYLFSDFAFFLVYYVFGYRKKVVMNNLDHAFPEKTKKERIRIAKKFYKNFIDTFIETIKMISASSGFLNKRIKGNWEVINQFKESGRSVQLHLGHNFNWEWANAVVAQKITLPLVAVYMPISNKIFEKMFYRLRSRYGTRLVRATHMREDFLPYRRHQYLLGLVADQSPGSPRNAWWFNFLGKPAPFVKGPGKNAVTNKTAVVFGFIHKIKRGYYELVCTLEEGNASETTALALTQKFINYLEDIIREYPDMWLWSHRRWKWEWKEEYGEIIQ
ncbi:MAG TPA: lysophospholipid acyltransferase family protein [Chitinophagaceae bacterium]|nr:lysophospholipid acyltransferase family protein [Chitinophagaceae bacterium]